MKAKVADYLAPDTFDQFTTKPFRREEIERGISNLNSGKVPGEYGVTKEHIHSKRFHISRGSFCIIQMDFTK